MAAPVFWEREAIARSLARIAQARYRCRKSEEHRAAQRRQMATALVEYFHAEPTSRARHENETLITGLRRNSLGATAYAYW